MAIQHKNQKLKIIRFYCCRYVVVNLARATPDLNIERNNDTDGFFEVCGFSDNIPKILDALGKNGFS